ncbi:uncharacterized protein [Heterodontus francisci]|uniref:uncharacterized protein n=1 Tax=Heterodontus francisci TaxID=7792 RepID=UPI00355B08AE
MLTFTLILFPLSYPCLTVTLHACCHSILSAHSTSHIHNSLFSLQVKKAPNSRERQRTSSGPPVIATLTTAEEEAMEIGRLAECLAIGNGEMEVSQIPDPSSIIQQLEREQAKDCSEEVAHSEEMLSHDSCAPSTRADTHTSMGTPRKVVGLSHVEAHITSEQEQRLETGWRVPIGSRRTLQALLSWMQMLTLGGSLTKGIILEQQQKMCEVLSAFPEAVHMIRGVQLHYG